MGSDPQFSRFPNLTLSQHIFTVADTDSSIPTSSGSRQTSIEYIQNAIQKDKMAPLYRHLCHPTEGVLNKTGEGTSSSGATLSRQTTVTSPKRERRASLVASNLLPIRKSGRKTESAVLAPQNTGLEWNETLYDDLKKDNDEELEGFQKEEDEAQEKAGEVEVQAARGKRAEFWARVGDKVRRWSTTLHFA